MCQTSDHGDYIFSPETIQEVKVISNAISAEHGRTVGGMISMVTRGGECGMQRWWLRTRGQHDTQFPKLQAHHRRIPLAADPTRGKNPLLMPRLAFSAPVLAAFVFAAFSTMASAKQPLVVAFAYVDHHRR